MWYYNPQLVTGIVLGYVTIKEYTFFVLETLFAGLRWWLLTRRINLKGRNLFHPKKFASARSLFFLYSGSYSQSSSLQDRHPTLIWALPVIAPQLLFGADILWCHCKLAVLTILPMTLYLSAVDSLAITASTWTIAPDQSTGILLGGVLPIEEAIFFLVTVALVTFGVSLFLAKEAQDRMHEWVPKLKTKS